MDCQSTLIPAYMYRPTGRTVRRTLLEQPRAAVPHLPEGAGMYRPRPGRVAKRAAATVERLTSPRPRGSVTILRSTLDCVEQQPTQIGYGLIDRQLDH